MYISLPTSPGAENMGRFRKHAGWSEYLNIWSRVDKRFYKIVWPSSRHWRQLVEGQSVGGGNGNYEMFHCCLLLLQQPSLLKMWERRVMMIAKIILNRNHNLQKWFWEGACAATGGAFLWVLRVLSAALDIISSCYSTLQQVCRAKQRLQRGDNLQCQWRNMFVFSPFLQM